MTWNLSVHGKKLYYYILFLYILFLFPSPPPPIQHPQPKTSSIICTLHNLAKSRRSSGYFLPTLLQVLWIQTYYSNIHLSHTVFQLLYSLYSDSLSRLTDSLNRLTPFTNLTQWITIPNSLNLIIWTDSLKYICIFLILMFTKYLSYLSSSVLTFSNVLSWKKHHLLQYLLRFWFSAFDSLALHHTMKQVLLGVYKYECTCRRRRMMKMREQCVWLRLLSLTPQH